MNARALLRPENLWAPLVLAALLLIYLPGLGNPPLFDDTLLTEGGLQSYGSLLEAKARMLSYGSFVWTQWIVGEGWWKQRLVNIALHAATVAALWAFYREILRHVEPVADNLHKSPALGFAIGCFALNPVAVYAVAYLVQRSIVMATLFAVLALWLFALALARRKPALHAAAFACYALAILSKEYAVLLPLAAVPVYIVVARPPARRLAALSAGGAVLVGLAAFALYSRYGEIIGKPFDENSRIYLEQLAALQPGADRNAYGLSILNQAYLFFHYGLRWFLPFAEWMSINLRPPFPVTWTTFPQVLGIAGYLAIVAGGFFLVLRFRDWRALAGLSLLLPALLFATEFVTVWVQDPFVLYRSYLWAIGVPGLVFIALHGASGRTLAVATVLVGGLLVWQALDRVFSMSSVDRAWSDAIAKMPPDPRSVGRWFPYLNRGVARVDNRQYNLAMQDFEISSKLGDRGAGVFNRGALYAANGEHANALASFDAAEREGYNLFNLPFQRALSLLALGRVQEAHPNLVKAYNMNPPSPSREILLMHLGRTALQLGRTEEAVGVLEQLLAVQPANADARFYLGMALVTRKDYARALEVLAGLPKDAPSGRAHYARALAHYGLGQRDAALADIEAAIRIGPDSPHLREWQSRIKAMK
jgi:lipoprotein NlpI